MSVGKTFHACGPATYAVVCHEQPGLTDHEAPACTFTGVKCHGGAIFKGTVCCTSIIIVERLNCIWLDSGSQWSRCQRTATGKTEESGTGVLHALNMVERRL